MSGENESKTQKTETVEEKHGRIQMLIKRYPSEVGLGLLRPANEVERFLTMTSTELRRLSAEECGEASIIINQEATYIQLQLNMIKADINWCNKYIEWLIARTITQYGTKYTPFEYRRLLASRDNDVAMKLHQIIANAEAKAECLAYIPNQLTAAAKSFSELQQTKRSQKL